MHQQGNNLIRQLQFSTPDRVGNANNNDNARQMLDLACTVANYRDFLGPMTVNIQGPSQVLTGGLASWCPSTTDCTTGVSYLWSWSEDGFSYTNFSTSTCVDEEDLPYSAVDIQGFLRVIATCSDGRTATDVHPVFIIGDPLFNKEEDPIKNSTAKEITSLADSSIEVDIYPNPTNGEVLTLMVNQDLPSRGEIYITDINGEKVKQLYTGLLEKGTTEIVQNISNLQAGIYYVVFLSESQIINNRVVITK